MIRRGFESRRVFGPDLARGVALLGMFAAHVVMESNENVYNGRSSILFATVAGVSLALLTGGSTPFREGRGMHRVSIAIRGAILIAIGVLLTAVVQPPIAVILEYYGLAFIVILPLLFAPRLVIAAAVVLIVAIAPPVVTWLQSDTDLAVVPIVLAPLAEWLIYGTYPVVTWIAFLLVGLICARSDLTRRRTQVTMVVAGALVSAIGYSAGALIPGSTAAAHSGTPAEMLGSGGLAVALIGVATLLGSVPGPVGEKIRIALYPVAAAGGMALTLYTAQAIALALIFDVTGYESDDWTYPEATLPLLIVGSLVVGTLWRFFLGAGPLERLVRLVTSAPLPRRSQPAPASRV